jgi:uroporphyrinogen-III decarboxylase
MVVRDLKGVFHSSQRPWIPIFAQMHDHAMALAGIPARTYYWDARTFVDTMAQVAVYYDMDNFMPVADVYNFEIEGMGAKMIYSDNAMPTIDFRDPLVKKPQDLRQLKTPDFLRNGRLPYALDCIKFGTEYGMCQSRFCAPFSMAVGMRSYPALVRDMRKQPEFARELFSFIVDEVLVPYLKVHREYCGITIARGADAWASVPNLSVKDLNEWVVPYNQRLMTKARELSMAVSSNSGDYNEERLEKFDAEILHGSLDVEVASQGSPSLFLGMGRWEEYPLEPVREYTAKYREQGTGVRVTAGINARLLRDGPVEKIVGTAKRFIAAFARDHELNIFLANIPMDTPPAHVHAAVAAIHTYGRKPIADNLEEIEFRMPERESFQEWKKGTIKQR